MASAAAALADRKQAFLDLYWAGWSDRRIARVLNMSSTTINKWRSRLGLEPNEPPPKRYKIDKIEAVRLYAHGASDHTIARRFDVGQSCVTRWRQRLGLEPNFEPSLRLDKDVIREARKLLSRGASRKQVTQDLPIASLNTVTRLRRGMSARGLRRTGLTNAAIRSRILKDQSVRPRIEKAIGTHLPRDVLYEATTEMYVDVLDGRLALELIEEHAGRYRQRAFSFCGSDYGPRSLDERTDHGWPHLQSLADPDALAAFDMIEFDPSAR
jgi:transposase